jgi:hypothetical protein
VPDVRQADGEDGRCVVKVVHAIVGGFKNVMTGGTHRLSLWCKARTWVSVGPEFVSPGVVVATDDLERLYHVTSDLQKVTCKACMALGGCGPNWSAS